MPDYMARWLYNRIVRLALRGRFYPAISAWGGAGVWSNVPDALLGGGMVFQYDEMDGDALWRVEGHNVALFRGGRLAEWTTS